MSNTTATAKWKDRKFRLLLYPVMGDTTAEKVLSLLSASGYEYCFIIHDCDIKENTIDTLKDLHYHVVISFTGSAIWSTSLAKQLGIETRFIAPCKSIEKSLQYLTHYNAPQKYRYNDQLLIGTSKLLKLYESSINDDGKERMDYTKDILDFIDSIDGFISPSELMRFCAETKARYSTYLSAQYSFARALDYHNFCYKNNT